MTNRKKADIIEPSAGIAELRAELEEVSELIQKCVDENARVPQDQAEYLQRYNALTARYDELKSRIVTAQTNRVYTVPMLDNHAVLDGFDEAVWCAVVAHVTVDVEGALAVTFKDGKTAKIS